MIRLRIDRLCAQHVLDLLNACLQPHHVVPHAEKTVLDLLLMSLLVAQHLLQCEDLLLKHGEGILHGYLTTRDCVAVVCGWYVVGTRSLNLG